LKSFLTGGAGMGKRVLTSALFQGLTRWYNDQPKMDKSSIKVLVLAPTGAVAFKVSGMTIHSGLGILTEQSIHKYRLLDTSRLNEMRSNFKDLRWIIIDEIFLVGKTMLAFVDQRLRQISGCNEFMGGYHVLFVGDLFQLKPVKDGYVFQDLKSGFNALGENFWVDNIEMYELYEQMRQQNARVYADRLNRVREGDQTPEDIAFFESLKIDMNNPSADYNVFIKHLFATNVQLDALAIQCKARNAFVARNLSMERRQILLSVFEGVEPKNFFGLHKTLNLRLGLLVKEY
jgi:hypothetical protein